MEQLGQSDCHRTGENVTAMLCRLGLSGRVRRVGRDTSRPRTSPAANAPVAASPTTSTMPTAAPTLMVVTPATTPPPRPTSVVAAAPTMVAAVPGTVAPPTATSAPAAPTSTPAPDRAEMVTDIDAAWEKDWPAAVREAKAAIAAFPNDADLRRKLLAVRISLGDQFASQGRSEEAATAYLGGSVLW